MCWHHANRWPSNDSIQKVDVTDALLRTCCRSLNGISFQVFGVQPVKDEEKTKKDELNDVVSPHSIVNNLADETTNYQRKTRSFSTISKDFQFGRR